ncbi:hypothetical protein BC834DRAFT_856987 [Gloeopeniophorella convolvens]|nr:hypothetical protein BC834DRAFT_856987 [Gloeopeniophorella convolvens]
MTRETDVSDWPCPATSQKPRQPQTARPSARGRAPTWRKPRHRKQRGRAPFEGGDAGDAFVKFCPRVLGRTPTARSYCCRGAGMLDLRWCELNLAPRGETCHGDYGARSSARFGADSP